MIRGRLLKTLSVFLALNLLIEIFSPTMAYALTGGPSQPELSSFEPVGTTDMVNLFSGDFVYNIPLLTVPGPDGGYPVNMSYHAGIGMEDEASWVGLGWNINAGTINRMMRGLPDDFNGDNVKKTFYTKPNSTVGISFGSPSIEIFNFDSEKGIPAQLSAGLYYNNYKGMGVKFGLDASAAFTDALSGRLNLSFDTHSGVGVTPSLSYSKENSDKNSFLLGTGTLGVTFHSRQGVSDLSFRTTFKRHREIINTGKTQNGVPVVGYGNVNNTAAGPGVSFSSSSFVPFSTNATAGTNVGLSFRAGVAGLGIFGKLKIGANFSSNWIKDASKNYSSYGYMYAHNSGENDLQDFNREKDIAVTKDAPYLAIPSFTYDVYSVQGQGMGGIFRPYRSDMGVLYDPKSKSHNAGGDVTVELGAFPDAKIGGDVNGTYGETYSGPWRNMPANFQDVYGFQNNAPDGDLSWFKPLYETYYMKASGDLTAAEKNEFNFIKGDDPVRFSMSMLNTDVSWQPKLSLNIDDVVNYDHLPETPIPTPVSITRKTRQRRSQNMIMRTIGELGGGSAQTPGKHIL
ncbi:MAG: hypothetical protein ACPF9D_10785, partial [Owenweeksia sp.]